MTGTPGRQDYREPPDGLTPELVVEVGGARRTLRPGSSYQVGRDPRSDIVVIDSRVSWHHAVFHAEGGAWLVEDRGSTNGTFVGSRKIGRFEIATDCALRLGNAADGPAVVCSVFRPAGPDRAGPGSSVQWSRVDMRPTAVMRAPVRTLRIGRAKDNDIVLADLSVSRYHAELRNIAGRYQIADVDSHNVTFRNGARVHQAPVTEDQPRPPAAGRLVRPAVRAGT